MPVLCWFVIIVVGIVGGIFFISKYNSRVMLMIAEALLLFLFRHNPSWPVQTQWADPDTFNSKKFLLLLFSLGPLENYAASASVCLLSAKMSAAWPGGHFFSPFWSPMGGRTRGWAQGFRAYFVTFLAPSFPNIH